MRVADYKGDTVRFATRDEVAAHYRGSELRLARDRGWPLPTELESLEGPSPAPRSLAR